MLSAKFFFHCAVIAAVNPIAGLSTPPAAFSHSLSPFKPPIPRVSEPLRAAPTYGSIPLWFEPNLGQSSRQVQFLTRVGRMTTFFATGETVMTAAGGRATVRMKLPGSSSRMRFEGLDRLPGNSNYFIGNEPGKWLRDVPQYGRIRAKDVYPGIDLVYYGNREKLEFDFVVSPGTDPSRIELAFDGVDGIHASSEGDLVLVTALGELRQHKPRVYQQIGGRAVEVSASYRVRGMKVGIELARYDRTRPLVIDPVIGYSTFFGGNAHEIAGGIAVDSTGAVYVSGESASTDLPAGTGYQKSPGAAGTGGTDAFVAKLNPAGTAIVYCTYLGGRGFQDVADGIAVHSDNTAYVTGFTTSDNFPVKNASQAIPGLGGDAFIARLNAAGNDLLFSTYLGATGMERGRAIALDPNGDAYITGDTDPDFPTRNPLQSANRGGVDAFIARYTAAGAKVWATYFGGNEYDGGYGIALDGAGFVYVAGQTMSTNLPATGRQRTNAGGFDAFVLKMNAAGTALSYVSYLGGTENEYPWGRCLAVDSAGFAYITGATDSKDFPLKNAHQNAWAGNRETFVAKLNQAGTDLVYSTYLGGSRADGFGGIALDSSGAVYISSFTESDDFPFVNPMQTNKIEWDYHSVLAKYDPSGKLVFSTLLGGSKEEQANSGLAVDKAGNVYIFGRTDSPDFPITAGAIDRAFAGVNETYITRYDGLAAAGTGPPATTSGITAATNAASFVGGSIVPGSIASLFGSGIGLAQGVLQASATPLPTALSGVQVLINNIPAPLFAMANSGGQEQINFQVAWEIAGSTRASIVVVNGAVRTAAFDVAVLAAQPGVFTSDGTTAVAVHGTNNQLITATNPAAPNEVVVVYVTGLGPVDRAQTSGVPASSSLLAKLTNTLTATLGGRTADVLFAGLVPGFAGLYQINLTVPPASVSDNLDLLLTVLGQTGKLSKIQVQASTTPPPTGLTGPFGIQFVQINPGTFMMGCSPGDECTSEELPAHRVQIAKAFQIGKYEVTQAQWQAAMGSNPSFYRGTDLPVEQVSRSDALNFIQKLNGQNDGYLYRLPSEAEWEYAARAGSTNKYAGATVQGDVAWVDINSGGKSHPVGQKQPNAWGLYDMLGNVWEWVQDYFGNYSSAAQTDPAGPASGSSRVMRGGSWLYNWESIRVSYRLHDDPSIKTYDLGFRCLREKLP